MSEKRRTGLGRGLGALIPQGPGTSRPVDVFFPDSRGAGDGSSGPVANLDADSARLTEVPNAVMRESVDLEDGRLAASHLEESAVSNHNSNTSSNLVPVPGARYEELDLALVAPNPNQPRTVFDEDELAELASSIREVGVLQPIVVRPVGERYEIVMGERRWRASQLAGQPTVPAIVRDTADTDLLRDALLENLHRTQLNPLEEAAAYQQLLDDFACTHEELAGRIARSRPQISNTLRLLRLPGGVQRRVAAGVLSAGHARALLGLSDQAAMERLAQRIVAEGLSVRATEEIVALGEDEPLRPEMRRRRRTGEHDEAMADLGRRLSDRWDTTVKIALGQRKGRIQIDFANVEDLERLLTALAPDEAGNVVEADSSQH